MNDETFWVNALMTQIKELTDRVTQLEKDSLSYSQGMIDLKSVGGYTCITPGETLDWEKRGIKVSNKGTKPMFVMVDLKELYIIGDNND